MMIQIFNFFAKRTIVTFSMVTDKACNIARSEKALNTLRNYRTASRSFAAFLLDTCQKNDIAVSKITPQLMARYATWLQTKQRKVCHNTMFCYMKNIRAMLNLYNPKKNYNHVFAGLIVREEPTRKRAVGKDVMGKILQLKATGNKALELAVALVNFSFAAMGMPFVDMAALRRENMKDDHIEYYRHKTKSLVRVPINNIILDTISRYKDMCSADYLLPIVHSTSKKDFAVDYHRALMRHNYQLKKIGVAYRLAAPFTSYVVRHTWATICFHTTKDITVVSQGLGHGSVSMTKRYLDEIGIRKMARASVDVIQSVMQSRFAAL